MKDRFRNLIRETNGIGKRKSGPRVVLAAVLLLALLFTAGCGQESGDESAQRTGEVSESVNKETENSLMQESAGEKASEEVIVPESSSETAPSETKPATNDVTEPEEVVEQEEKEPETFDEMIEYLNNSGYSGLKLIVYYFEDQKVKLLGDGEDFVWDHDDCCAILYYSEKAKEISDSTRSFNFLEINDNSSDIVTTFSNKKSTITVTTEEGNVYQITNNYIYIYDE